MQISKFIHNFKAIDLNWVVCNHIEEEIYSFKPYPKQKDFTENMLYIGFLSNLSLPNQNTCYNFLCINDMKGDLDIDALKTSYQHSNLILAPSNLHLYKLMDLASEVFLAEVKYTSLINQIISASNENKGLEYLVDIVYFMLKSPLIIVDSSYKILAMYKNTTIESRPDLEIQRDLGYLTPQNIQRMRQDKLYEKSRLAKYPYYQKALDEEYGWLSALVYIHGVEVAQIGMMEHHSPFTSYDFEFLHFFSQLVSWEMQKNDFYKDNRGLMHSVFLSDLIDAKIPNKKIADFRKEQLKWIDAPFLYVFTIIDQELEGFNQKAQVIAYQIQHMLNTSRFVIYDSKLVFLIQHTIEDLSAFQENTPLSDFLKSNHLTGFMSNCFCELLEVRKYYLQTLTVADLKQFIAKQKNIYFYSDYIFYHIGQILSEKYALSDFFHPAIRKMIQYDQENQSNFVDTLYEFLIHVNNPTLSAQHLFIHKNTFFYRMNKIRDLFQLDLDDGKERLKLHMTLELMKLN